MYCGNTTFACDYEFKVYMKVEGAVLEDIFDYLFDTEVGKFLSKKGKKYLLKLFEKWDSDHLQLDEDFDDYPNNDSLKNIIGDKDM